MSASKLIVTDNGDSTVGIFPQTWEVDTPFANNLTGELYTTSKDEIDFFRNKIIDVYKEYAQGKITALYDFEISEINKQHEANPKK